MAAPAQPALSSTDPALLPSSTDFPILLSQEALLGAVRRCHPTGPACIPIHTGKSLLLHRLKHAECLPGMVYQAGQRGEPLRRPVQGHAAMVENTVHELAISGEAGVIEIVDVITGHGVASGVSCLPRSAGLDIVPVGE